MRFDLIVGVRGLACSSEAWCRPFADRSWHRAPEEAPEPIYPMRTVNTSWVKRKAIGRG